MTAFSRAFIGENLIKVDSDLDIDFDKLLSDNTAVIVKLVMKRVTLSTESRTRSARPQDVQEVDFIEGFGLVYKLPVDSEPAHNFWLYFGNETFKLMQLMAYTEITNCKK